MEFLRKLCFLILIMVGALVCLGIGANDHELHKQVDLLLSELTDANDLFVWIGIILLGLGIWDFLDFITHKK